MKTIHKFELRLTDAQELRTFHPIKPLSVQLQRNAFCMWAETEMEFVSSVQDLTPQPKQKRNIYRQIVHVVGTGQEIPDGNLEYISTVQSGEFVWHFYLERLA
jgi:hypothetical protein